MKSLGQLVRVRAVEPLEGFRARVTFEDGTQRDIDLEDYLHGPIFETIRSDLSVFCSMKVEEGRLPGRTAQT